MHKNVFAGPYIVCSVHPKRVFVLTFTRVAIVDISCSDSHSLTYDIRDSKSVLIHQLSKRLTQRIPFKTKGIPVSTAFHPTRSIFFTATKKDVCVYDFLKEKLIKRLESGLREISSLAIHPNGMCPSLSHTHMLKKHACNMFIGA